MNNINIMLENWQKQKPIHVDLKPAKCLQTLKDFHSKFLTVENSLEILANASDVLDIPKLKKEIFLEMVQEANDLKEVWSCLNDNSIVLETIKRVRWNTDACWSVRLQLEEILLVLKSMPNKIRHYAAFEFFKDDVATYLNRHLKLLVLKSEALRQRHWDKIISNLAFQNCYLDDLTMAHLWDSVKLQTNPKLIEDVIITAQGFSGLI
jgi:dynein heavy chain 1